MVKLPGMDDLKKMGADLLDSAKTVNIGGMVDKLKTGIESVSSKKTTVETPISDDPRKNLLHAAQLTLAELMTAQATQVTLSKTLQTQLKELAALIEAQDKQP